MFSISISYDMWVFLLCQVTYFSLMIKLASRFQGSVHLEYCSSVTMDVILTFGSLCSGLAYTPGFENLCHSMLKLIN